jgi:TnpA family transposase
MKYVNCLSVLSREGQPYSSVVRNYLNFYLSLMLLLTRTNKFVTWTSDQFAQYGVKVTPSTIRDSTYVLDEILDNETELPIVEHTTDTAGYTELVFAVFDLLGLQFSPRIRDLGGQRLYRIDRDCKYQNIEPLLSTIKTEQILNRWDDLLRVVGSFKLGWVSASLFINKLKSFPQQNDLANSLAEYGRMVKTIFILRYLQNQEYRRKINNQLNKGERLHDLRRFLFFAHQGQIRQRQEEELTNQASCLNLVTNAVVTWNTLYMEAAIEQLISEGHQIDESDITHLSPTRYEHINPYGKYQFDIEAESKRVQLRPLRKP